MPKLIPIKSEKDIPQEYRGTPIGLLCEYHNLGKPYDNYANAQLLIGMCMDSRKHLHIPDNFAFIIRAGGANLRHSEFKISYAIAVGGVRAIALMGHNHCGMVNILSRKEQFLTGLVEGAGWSRQAAEENFAIYSAIHEIGNEVDFVLSEVKRLRLRYPKIMVAPFFYNVEDGLLSFIKE